MPDALLLFFHSDSFWQAVTRLGEAQVMLPAVLAVALWLGLRPAGRPLALWWLGMLGLAAVVTTASKVAFIGYGWGIASLDFTGVSGHAMFAAAVYPLLFRTLAATLRRRFRHAAIIAGWALALLIGVSRLEVSAHSMPEVVAGLMLGGAAAVTALWLASGPALRLPLWLPLISLVSLLTLGTAAPPSRSHDMVTRLSLALSGRSVPYTRHHLLHPAASVDTEPALR